MAKIIEFAQLQEKKEEANDNRRTLVLMKTATNACRDSNTSMLTGMEPNISSRGPNELSHGNPIGACMGRGSVVHVGRVQRPG